MEKLSFKRTLLSGLLLGIFLITVPTSCKKDEEDEPDAENKYALVIENGAQKINPDESLTYSAKLVDTDGNTKDPEDITWTTSDSEIATISGNGSITVVGQGTVTVTASVTIGGSTLTAQAPLGIYAPSLFTVAPAAILYEEGGSLQLESIYLSTNGVVEPDCSYESSDQSIASVNSDGIVSFNKAGSCYITVTATSLDGQPTNIVPVTVIGAISVPLPVTRVEVSPSSKDLFQDETVQLTSKAFDGDGQEVSGKTPIWSSGNVNVVNVNNNGLVTPVNPGETFVYATIDGISGQAYLTVNPDTLVWIEPLYANVPAGDNKQFTAEAYQLARNSATLIPEVTFNWEIPTYGLSMFDIATVDNSGLVSVKSDAMPGMMALVMAYDVNNPHVAGGAMVIAAVAQDCNCGENHPEISYITVNQSNVNLDMMSATSFQIQATAYDSQDNPISADIVYCSNNIMAASVDDEGLIVAAGEGEATITVCVGNVSTQIIVNVSMF